MTGQKLPDNSRQSLRRAVFFEDHAELGKMVSTGHGCLADALQTLIPGILVANEDEWGLSFVNRLSAFRVRGGATATKPPTHKFFTRHVTFLPNLRLIF